MSGGWRAVEGGRLVFRVSQETRERWHRLFQRMEVRDYEEALRMLMDIYEALASRIGYWQLAVVRSWVLENLAPQPEKGSVKKSVGMPFIVPEKSGEG